MENYRKNLEKILSFYIKDKVQDLLDKHCLSPIYINLKNLELDVIRNNEVINVSAYNVKVISLCKFKKTEDIFTTNTVKLIFVIEKINCDISTDLKFKTRCNIEKKGDEFLG